MNRIPGFESDHARWQVQERALSGTPRDPVDALLAQALRTLPSSSPPSDFAAGVARAATHARSSEASCSRGEQVLVWGLVAAMAIGAVVCAFVYGSVWATTIASAVGDRALQWGLAAAACLAVSVLPWRRAMALAARTPSAV
ncbi:hypothetical protein LDO31_11275 [Luteimonas sp. XNQY3]|nr:hypothetical protein [Luteimonas sp. XNQY3]MCD9006807.1 hypothetical protein [Luteimonas sp. XNQY3]